MDRKAPLLQKLLRWGAQCLRSQQSPVTSEESSEEAKKALRRRSGVFVDVFGPSGHHWFIAPCRYEPECCTLGQMLLYLETLDQPAAI